MAQAAWAVNEKPSEALESVPLDAAWLKHMPEGSEVISTVGHGASFWSQAARIDVRLQDGQDQTFFIKLTRSANMVKGEFNAMGALHEIMPDMVPKPLAYGTFEQDPTRHFFLCEFLDLYEDLPDIVDFCRDVATLHRKSMDKNTTGMFGFDTTTCNGSYEQDNSWSPSWEAFFASSLQKKFNTEIDIHGPCDAYDELLPVLFNKVLPALLRPLETEGRTLKPCLVHGDLWDGNTGIHADSGRTYIFDSAAFWAHNEYELGIWRGERFKFRGAYTEEYFKNFPQSPPEKDWDNRQLLYSVSADLVDSILFETTSNFRDLVIESLRTLTAKYAAGYTGSAERKDIALAKAAAQAQSEDDPAHVTPKEHRIGMSRLQIEDNRPSIKAVLQPKMSSDQASLHSDRDGASTPREMRYEIQLGESAISPPESSIVPNFEARHFLNT